MSFEISLSYGFSSKRNRYGTPMELREKPFSKMTTFIVVKKATNKLKVPLKPQSAPVGIFSAKEHNKNVSYVQVCKYHSLTPPTLPLIRVVL